MVSSIVLTLCCCCLTATVSFRIIPEFRGYQRETTYEEHSLSKYHYAIHHLKKLFDIRSALWNLKDRFQDALSAVNLFQKEDNETLTELLIEAKNEFKNFSFYCKGIDIENKDNYIENAKRIGHKCYTYHQHCKSFQGASNDCKKRGGQLAVPDVSPGSTWGSDIYIAFSSSIRDKFTKTFRSNPLKLNGQMPNKVQRSEHFHGGYVWVGGQFIWDIDGEDLGTFNWIPSNREIDLSNEFWETSNFGLKSGPITTDYLFDYGDYSTIKVILLTAPDRLNETHWYLSIAHEYSPLDHICEYKVIKYLQT